MKNIYNTFEKWRDAFMKGRILNINDAWYENRVWEFIWDIARQAWEASSELNMNSNGG